MDHTDNIGLLVEALAVSHPARLSQTVTDTLAAGGKLAVVIWVSDIGGTHLSDLAGVEEDQEVDGTLAGRAFRDLEIIVSDDHLLAPLESLGRVMGVIEARGSGLETRQQEMMTAARVITDRLISAKGHSDMVERARGAGDLGLAATIQYDMMPIPSYIGDQVEMGGWVEPAYDIAGDAWDYAINEGEVDFGIFDSVGHGLRACQLSMVALGSFRLARRRGGTLREIAAKIDDGLREILNTGEFVTSGLGRALPHESKLELANAGHLAPIRIRNGKASRLEWEAALPFGLDGKDPSMHTFEVQSGDSFYLFSDGVIEAVDSERTPFGPETLSDLLQQANSEERTVKAICRLVLDAVIEHVGGPLRDDATVLGIRFV
jgi:serine phosphatase RsbU (regulator of sigma subunit)